MLVQNYTTASARYREVIKTAIAVHWPLLISPAPLSRIAWPSVSPVASGRSVVSTLPVVEGRSVVATVKFLFCDKLWVV